MNKTGREQGKNHMEEITNEENDWYHITEVNILE